MIDYYKSSIALDSIPEQDRLAEKNVTFVEARSPDYSEDFMSDSSELARTPIEVKGTPSEECVETYIASTSAVVCKVGDRSVDLKFHDNLVVTLPIELFGPDSPTWLHYGTPVIYSVKTDLDGFRYQIVERDVQPAKNPMYDKVMGLLKSIPDAK